MKRPWSNATLQAARSRFDACMGAYHAPRACDDHRVELTLRVPFDAAIRDMRAILDYRLRVRRACAAVLATGEVSDV